MARRLSDRLWQHLAQFGSAQAEPAPAAPSPPRDSGRPIAPELLWDPVPGTRIRPDAEVPGPWSPLLALAPRLRVVLQLVQRARARLAPSGPDRTDSPSGRLAGVAQDFGPDGPQRQEG